MLRKQSEGGSLKHTSYPENRGSTITQIQHQLLRDLHLNPRGKIPHYGILREGSGEYQDSSVMTPLGTLLVFEMNATTKLLFRTQ